tara:strand:+ start:280 stop:489 length:210 start_codon:yes stop_codon:yes gene_type:complete
MAKSASEKYQEFQELSEEYRERFPKEEDPRNYSAPLGMNEITRILKEADGRKIVFTEGDGEDEVFHSFA